MRALVVRPTRILTTARETEAQRSEATQTRPCGLLPVPQNLRGPGWGAQSSSGPMLSILEVLWARFDPLPVRGVKRLRWWEKSVRTITEHILNQDRGWALGG